MVDSFDFNMDKQENPLLSFYIQHNISPVHQDIKHFKNHLLRREKLYRMLGLPPIAFSNKTVLEIGPGGGFNSLVLFNWGAKLEFVEPNPKAQKELMELLYMYNINENRWKLFPKKVEEFNFHKKYDIVIAEGFIPGLKT